MGRHSSAPKPAGRPAADTCWIYLQLELDDICDAATVLLDIVAPAIAAEPAVHRWFHLQYADATGVALRIRLEVDTAHRVTLARRLRSVLQSAPASDQGSGLQPGQTKQPRILEVRPRLYAPEYEKFGGRTGMASAHRIFCAGTDLALAILPSSQDRIVLNAALQRALTEKFGQIRGRTFLYHYAWYWAGRGVLGPLWQHTVSTLPAGTGGRPTLVGRADTLLQDGRIGAALQRFASLFWTEVGQARQQAMSSGDPVLDPAFVLHTHLHLVANRLGILPAQEAYTARVLSVAA